MLTKLVNRPCAPHDEVPEHLLQHKTLTNSGARRSTDYSCPQPSNYTIYHNVLHRNERNHITYQCSIFFIYLSLFCIFLFYFVVFFPLVLSMSIGAVTSEFPHCGINKFLSDHIVLIPVPVPKAYFIIYKLDLSCVKGRVYYFLLPKLQNNDYTYTITLDSKSLICVCL